MCRFFNLQSSHKGYNSLLKQKEPVLALFVLAEYGDYTPVHLKMHRVRKPDEPDKSNSDK